MFSGAWIDRMAMGRDSGPDRDRSFAVAARAQDLMRRFGPAATPRCYAVWYAHAAGDAPPLTEAVRATIERQGHLTDADVERLHSAYLDGDGSAEPGPALLDGIGSVLEILQLSLGTTERYDQSLRAASDGLSNASENRAALAEIVASLFAATQEVAATNRLLEVRMRESRGEIEALRESLEASRAETLTDPLTGLANRRRFDQALRRAVEGGAGSLVVIDIDTFKRFNDRFGHLTGDQVLRLVATVMRESVRSPATLARFGGEEFGIVLPGADRDEARAVAEDVRRSVMGRELVKRTTGESLGRVTLSLGVAGIRPGDTADALLERADLCLYAAKCAGRNRTVVDGAEPGLQGAA